MAIATKFKDSFGNVVDIGGGEHTYSTEEQVVGKWIDGRDVYEMTIEDSASHFNSNPLYIEGLEKVISIDGTLTTIYNDTYPIQSYWNDIYCRICHKSNNSIAIASMTNTRDIRFTIRYIKTT